jgi:hypothetical protein
MTSPNGREALERFLATDPSDAGCERTIELLDAYAELIVAGEDPEIRHPGIAAHLRTCLPCADDLDGLLATLRATELET